MVELPAGVDDEARSYIDALLAQAAAEEAFAVVLTGSMARDVRPGLWSDVDLFVLDLSPDDPPASIHLFEVKVTRFEQQVACGDDVSQWAARFGRPLFGETRWRSLVRDLLPRAPWPDHLVKLAQSRRRLEVGRMLLDAGDARSAQKELVYAASHLARSILLERRIFPLSRPELPVQLHKAKEPVIAHAVESLASAPVTSIEELQTLWDALDERHLRSHTDGFAEART
jgi:hypothetical protein